MRPGPDALMVPSPTPVWPGWTPQKTLLLPIDPGTWAPPVAGVRVDAQNFAPKPELHVTLVGRRLGQLLLASPAERRYRTLVARTAFEALDWRWRRTQQLLWLEKHGAQGGPDDRMHALVELIELPAMADFHRQLGTLLGRELPVPPPHVTLYTAGKARGIGVPTQAALREFTVRAVSPSEFQAPVVRQTGQHAAA